VRACTPLFFFQGIHWFCTKGTVLLHLYAGALARRLLNSSPSTPRLPTSEQPTAIRIHAIHIPVPSPFPQLEEFIQQAVEDYNIDLFHCDLETPEDEKKIWEKGQISNENEGTSKLNSLVKLDSIPESKSLQPEEAKRIPVNSSISRPTPLSAAAPTPAPIAIQPVIETGRDNMRQALHAYKDRFPHIAAILLGTRRTDPHGGTSIPSSSAISSLTSLIDS
jgi:FAD synthetase